MVSQGTRRFTVMDYERIHAAGILTEDDRVELIAGEIVQMSPIGARHVGCVIALTELLSKAGNALVSVQNPICLTDDSQPQPDLAVLHRHPYADRLPTTADVLLVIEVADSSLDYDREVKLPLYAAAGITETWIVDFVTNTVERYTEPHDGLYRFVARARRGETLASTVLPTLTIPISTILG